MIDVADHAEGCIIAVHAQPGAKRNAVVGAHGQALKVAVTAAADKGRANQALAEVIAETLGLKRGQVELVTGSTNRAKRFLIRGLDAKNVSARLSALLQK